MSESRYIMAGIIVILLGLIGFSYYKSTQLHSSSPSSPVSTYTPPSTYTTTFPTNQPYILQINTNGQTVLTPRVIFNSIETVLITTSTTSHQTTYSNVVTTYAYVTPTYTYYKNTTDVNLTLTTQITYNVQYGEYNIKYGGITSTVPVYTPTPQSINYNLPVEVLNVNDTLITTYNGTIELPTTLVTTYVAYTSQVPIRYTYYSISGLSASSIRTTVLSVPITITTQVVFSLPSQISIEGGKGNMVISIFEKNSTNQFKVGADICQSVSQQLGSHPVNCLIQYSSTTNEEENFIIQSTAKIAESRKSVTGITTNSTTFLPAQHCTPFKNSVVTIQSATATYNGSKYKLEIEPQGLSFSLGNIYICSTILTQQVDIFVFISET